MEITQAEKTVVYHAAVGGKDPRAAIAALRTSAVLDPSQERETDIYLASLEEKGIFPVTVFSDDYPELLKNVNEPPLLLYGMGNRALLKERKFCVVGSRVTPPYAMKEGQRLAEALSERFVIVTGFAEGGDSAAIAGALPKGRLICVLPCGLSRCYPSAHHALKERVKAQGLLLSEYPPEAPAAKYAFHARNRILAGLSEGVLVLSAGEKSGALITADRALSYGRDVFALPYNIGVAQGAGCNGLIKNGAYLVTSEEDIFSVYGMRVGERTPPQLGENAARILNVLRARGEAHIAELADAVGLQVFETSALLSELEIKGLAVKTGGNRYSALS